VRRHCQVDGCRRPGHWGREGYPGHICRHHALIWRDSQARLDVLAAGRRWARERAAREAARRQEVGDALATR